MNASDIRASQTRTPTLQSTETEGGAHCRVDIRIESQGDVNVYNCQGRAPRPECPAPLGCSTGPIAPGQCVPLSIGAKPKQSLRTKLNSLLQNTRVPSTIASGFFQHARRFSAGHS